MKICIIGYARAGKDELARVFSKHFGVSFQSSSEAACKLFIFDALKDKYGYKTWQECMDDRYSHRSEWYDLISDYNHSDPTRLAREILKTNDIYVGMRDDIELARCVGAGLFDLVIWVDGEKRVGVEPVSSCKVRKEHADIIIDNNGDKLNFHIRALRLGFALYGAERVSWFTKTIKKILCFLKIKI